MALAKQVEACVEACSPEGPHIREASAIEAYNVPLFEVPPMLDVRSRDDFLKSHVLCAVSIPLEDGPDEIRLLQRILDHDDEWSWCLQHPFFIVYDEATRGRAEWLAGVLRKVALQHAGSEEVDAEDRGGQLLRRLARQCQQLLFLAHQEFEEHFAFCCVGGENFASIGLFQDLGPLPRCALLKPRVFLGGRQVWLTPKLMSFIGVTHVAVNGDAWDAMNGTSGGGSQFERPVDVQGVRYLKCDVPDCEEDPDIPQVLAGVAQFLSTCAEEGGVSLVRIHGQSRSASAICAFLMLARRISVQVAWEAVQRAGVRLDERLVWWSALRSLEPGAGPAALPAA